MPPRFCGCFVGLPRCCCVRGVALFRAVRGRVCSSFACRLRAVVRCIIPVYRGRGLAEGTGGGHSSGSVSLVVSTAAVQLSRRHHLTRRRDICTAPQRLELAVHLATMRVSVSHLRPSAVRSTLFRGRCCVQRAISKPATMPAASEVLDGPTEVTSFLEDLNKAYEKVGAAQLTRRVHRPRPRRARCAPAPHAAASPVQARRRPLIAAPPPPPGPHRIRGKLLEVGGCLGEGWRLGADCSPSRRRAHGGEAKRPQVPRAHPAAGRRPSACSCR
jgi:hypothetical protein